MEANSDIVYSNSQAALSALLHSKLQTQPIDPPSSRSLIIVPSQLVKKELERTFLELSEEKVVAGALFLELSPALRLLCELALHTSAHPPSKLLVTLELTSILLDFMDDPDIGEYLCSNPSVRIPGLASHLARVFIKRGTYQSSEHWAHPWQKKVYDALFSTWKTPKQILGDRMRKPPVAHTIHVYGFEYLPQLYYRFFSKLSIYCPVTWYITTPSPHYWGDAYGDEAPSVLREYGTYLRKTIDGLTDANYQESHLFIPPATALQESMFSLTPLTRDEEHIAFHEVSSAEREVEVLFREILSLGIRYEDALVLAPNIDSYAPSIHRIFGARMPYRIFDTAAHLFDPYYKTLLVLLEIAQKRIEFDDITELLESAPIQEMLGLTPSDAHGCLRWLERGGFRWGLDTSDRSEISDEDASLGSMENALDKLAAAFMTVSYDLELSIELTDMHMLDALMKLYLLLKKHTVRSYAQTRSSAQWRESFGTLLDDFFGNTEGYEKLSRLFQTLFDPLPANGRYSSEAILRFVRDAVAQKKQVFGAHLLEGISFAELTPAHIVEKPHIFVLGADENNIPRQESVSPLDEEEAITEYYPTRTQEDAHCVLKAAMLARHKVHFFYSSVHAQDGRPQALSPILEPLARCAAVHTHPTVSFDPKAFAFLPLDKALFTAHYRGKAPAAYFAPDVLSSEPLPQMPDVLPEEIFVQHVRSLLRHPLRFFTKQVLNVSLDEGAVDPLNKDFQMDRLDSYRCKQKYWNASSEEIVRYAERHAVFPFGKLKEPALHAMVEHAASVQKMCAECGIESLYTIELRADCRQRHVVSHEHVVLPAPSYGGARFVGKIANVSDKGLVVVDDTLFLSWGDILIFSLLFPERCVWHLKKGRSYALPKEGLDGVLRYYAEALHRPPLLFTELSTPFLEGNAESIDKKIQQKISGFPYDDPYMTLYFPDKESVNGEAILKRWGELAQALYGPFKEWNTNAGI